MLKTQNINTGHLPKLVLLPPPDCKGSGLVKLQCKFAHLTPQVPTQKKIAILPFTATPHSIRIILQKNNFPSGRASTFKSTWWFCQLKWRSIGFFPHFSEAQFSATTQSQSKQPTRNQSSRLTKRPWGRLPMWDRWIHHYVPSSTDVTVLGFTGWGDIWNISVFPMLFGSRFHFEDVGSSNICPKKGVRWHILLGISADLIFSVSKQKKKPCIFRKKSSYVFLFVGPSSRPP